MPNSLAIYTVTSVDDVERAIGLSVGTDAIGAEKHVIDIGCPAQRRGAIAVSFSFALSFSLPAFFR